MKILKIGKTLTVVLGDNTILTHNNCTDALFNEVFNSQEDEEAVKNLLVPKEAALREEFKAKAEIMSNFNDSKYLTVFGPSVYIKSISDLTLPEDLAMAIHKAEKEEDEEKIQSYLNFWTLVSNNPDSRARTNLFWFLNRYGMVITQSGLFVAYRNVKIKEEGTEVDAEMTEAISAEFMRVRTKMKKSPKNYSLTLEEDEDGNEVYKSYANDSKKLLSEDLAVLGNLQELYNGLSTKTKEATVYTDSYTGSMNIRFGEIVSIPRDRCNPDPNVTCSSGLHVAGRGWLSSKYFGDTSIMVLINPADVIAVPHEDHYGKMRVCAYLPCNVVKRDEKGEIIQDFESGFEDGFIDKISYALTHDGNLEDGLHYTFQVPNIPELNKNTIISRLEDISLNLKKKII